MVCLGYKLEAAGWKAQTNTLSYGASPNIFNLLLPSCRRNFTQKGQLNAHVQSRHPEQATKSPPKSVRKQFD